MRAPCVIRWPGHIKPGTVFNQMFASLDWVPTFVDIAGGPKGDGLKQQIEKGAYPGIVKTTLDGVDQRAYIEGEGQSARDTFFYYTGKQPSAVRYKNWKIYFTMVPTSNAAAALAGATTFHWAQVDNIRRDPFEMATGETQGTLLGEGGALAGPVTAYLYDWNLLPIGQQLWLRELESYVAFPPLQSPESYNLDQVLQQVKDARMVGHASD